MAGLHTKPIEGRTELETESSFKIQAKQITGRRIDTNKRALDVVPAGYYYLDSVTPDSTVISGDTLQIEVTAHGAKVGDLVRFITTSLDVGMYENYIEEIVDADNFILVSPLLNNITAGDTIQLLRAVAPRYSSDGASLAQLTPDAIKIMLDGVVTDVAKDTVTPSNTIPVPVEVVAASGTPINITAGDLNVQLSHATANYDSTRIGDGTDLLGINADGSINAVVTSTDLDIRDLTHVSDSVKVGDGTDLLAVNADGSINAVVTSTDLDIRNLAHTQDSVRVGDGTDLLAVNADGSINAVVTSTDLDIRNLAHTQDSVRLGDGTDLVEVSASGRMHVEATLTDGTDLLAINADGSINATVSSTALTNLDTNLGAQADAAASSDAGTFSLISLVKRSLVRWTALLGLLPSSLGQKTMANSFAVTLASDQTAINYKEQVADTTPSVGSLTTIGSGGTSNIVAPSGNPYELFLQADITNSAKLRVGFVGSLPTTSSGYQLNPGESIGPIKTSVDARVIAESGSNQKLHYIWTSRA